MACWVDGLDELKDSIKPKGETERPTRHLQTASRRGQLAFFRAVPIPVCTPNLVFALQVNYFLVYTVWGSTKTSFSQERVTGAIEPGWQGLDIKDGKVTIHVESTAWLIA